MGQVEYGGSWYLTVKQAAHAWSGGALPDASVIGADEDPKEAAKELEAYVWGEEQKAALGAPEGVDEGEWREACREAILARIERHRAGGLSM